MFLSLASSSRGNAAIIKNDDTTILVDCGISGKKLTQILRDEGISCDEIDALLITHEHSDHTIGAGIISRRFDIPVYATQKTHEKMDIGLMRDENIKIIDKECDFEIRSIGIRPFSISHDAADPVGYSLFCGKSKYSIATDTGIMTDTLFDAISGSDFIMLEANHDIDMLMYGEYPYHLKKRIMSKLGHLSNDIAAQTAVRLLNCNTKHIMLGHLSEKNNEPHIAYKTVENALIGCGARIGEDIGLCVANRYEVTRFV